MNTFRRDFESEDDYYRRIARRQPLTVETDVGNVLEEPAKPKVIVKPGNYYARLAFKQGNEDEYSDRMRSKYGGEW